MISSTAWANSESVRVSTRANVIGFPLVSALINVIIDLHLHQHRRQTFSLTFSTILLFHHHKKFFIAFNGISSNIWGFLMSIWPHLDHSELDSIRAVNYYARHEQNYANWNKNNSYQKRSDHFFFTVRGPFATMRLIDFIWIHNWLFLVDKFRGSLPSTVHFRTTRRYVTRQLKWKKWTKEPFQKWYIQMICKSGDCFCGAHTQSAISNEFCLRSSGH